MIALVIAGESIVEQHSFNYATRMSLAWGRSGDAASNRAIESDILCFGDSLMKLGVQPRLLQAGLGHSAYNLAVPGGQAASTYYLFRQAMEAGARPEAVFVNFHENLLAVAPRFSKDVLPHLLTRRDWVDLTCHARDPDLSSSTGLALLLPSYRDRAGLREEILAKLRGSSRAMQEDLHTLDHNWRQNSGAQFVDATGHPSSTHAASPSPNDRASPSGWSPHPVNLHYLQQFFRLAKHHEIDVYWILPPTRRDWTARRDLQGVSVSFDKLANKITSIHNNVRIIDGRRADFSDDVFLDETHLNSQGAVAFSQGLILALDRPSRLRGRPAEWIALNTFGEILDDPISEELEIARQSMPVWKRK